MPARMLLLVAIHTKRYAIRDVEPQLWKRRKGLYVMGMEIDATITTTSGSTMLAGIFISRKHGETPILVFRRRPQQPIGGSFRSDASAPFALGRTQVGARRLIGGKLATTGAILANLAFFSVLGHCLSTGLTCRRLRQTARANLIKHCSICRPSTAHPACDAYSSAVCGVVGGAGPAGRPFADATSTRHGRARLSARRTWNGQGSVALPAQNRISALAAHLTEPKAFSFHVGNLAELTS